LSFAKTAAATAEKKNPLMIQKRALSMVPMMAKRTQYNIARVGESWRATNNTQ